MELMHSLGKMCVAVKWTTENFIFSNEELEELFTCTFHSKGVLYKHQHPSMFGDYKCVNMPLSAVYILCQ